MVSSQCVWWTVFVVDCWKVHSESWIMTTCTTSPVLATAPSTVAEFRLTSPVSQFQPTQSASGVLHYLLSYCNLVVQVLCLCSRSMQPVGVLLPLSSSDRGSSWQRVTRWLSYPYLCVPSFYMHFILADVTPYVFDHNLLTISYMVVPAICWSHQFPIALPFIVWGLFVRSDRVDIVPTNVHTSAFVINS